MDTEKLIAAIGQSRSPAVRQTDECLPPEGLAAYVDGELRGSDRDEAEEHLARCAYCLGQIAVLSRSQEDTTTTHVPSSVLKQAEGLGKPPQRLWINAPRWAAAAVVVLAIGFAVERYNSAPVEPGADPAATIQDDNFRLTRTIDSRALRPEILAPSPNLALPVSGPEFKWTQIPGSLYYDIRLVSAEGEVVWQERVKDTHTALPEQLELAASTNYYVRIDAYLAEAKRVSSRHVRYTTEDRP